jgi:hypothetical protein
VFGKVLKTLFSFKHRKTLLQTIITTAFFLFSFLKKQFFISKANSLKVKGAHLKYTGSKQDKNTHQDQEWGRRAHKSTNSDIERGALTEFHSKSDSRNHNCSFELVFSQSSKLQAFISLQMNHIEWEGITFQIMLKSFWHSLPFQHAKSSTTHLGITHSTPNIWKTKFYNSFTISQWRRQSSVFPLFLHIQHQSITMMWRLQRLSIVRIFPKDVIHLKKKKKKKKKILKKKKKKTKKKN